MRQFLIKYRKVLIFATVGLIHVAVLLLVSFALPAAPDKDKEEYEVLKLVDIEEYVPPPPPPKPEEKAEIVYNQPKASEEVIETENKVIETDDPAYAVVEAPEPEYLPQYKISVVPDIPTREILANIEYPPIALRQGIEGVVYLELYIDQEGHIRKTTVLKDPGYGFADAALAALDGITCKPAQANGVPVAVRFRYPVRFSLK